MYLFCDKQKPQIGYKDLMKGYQNKVNTLAGSTKTEVSLVVNLFQSVLDGFIRGELKRGESEPAKVNKRISVNHQSQNYLVSVNYHLNYSYILWLLSCHQDDEEEEEKNGHLCKLNIFTCIVKFLHYTSK